MKTSFVQDPRPLLLFVSEQQLNRAGHQVLFRSLEGYLRGGFRVTAIFPEPAPHEAGNVATIEEVFGSWPDGLRVHRVQPPLGRVTGLARALWAKRPKRRERDASDVAWPRDDLSLGFQWETKPLPEVTYARYLLLWDAMVRAGRRIAAEERPVVVCGNQCGGAPPASKLAAELGVPCFTKFLGSLTLPYLLEGNLRPVRVHLRGQSAPADLYVVHNDGSRPAESLRLLGVPDHRMRVWIDGVRKDLYQPEVTRAQLVRELDLPLGPNDRVISNLSNHNGTYKRLDRTVRALAALSRRRPEVHLVLPGQGATTKSLQALARELGVAERVHFPGRLVHKRVALVLNGSDVYMNTNDVSNLSNTVLEALVCHRPVVSMADGSLDGVVADGENGLLVPVERGAAGLADAVGSLLDDRALASRLSAGAGAFADSSLHNWEDRMVMEVEAVQELVATRGGPRDAEARRTGDG